MVELEHGELGVVPRGHALVAEVAVDFEDLLEAPDHQALEVQLRRDAQVHRQVQRVVVGLERLGRRAARDHLQHRGFHFEEAALGEELADVGDDLGTHAEGLAGFLVDDQVDVALTIALLGVGQAVVLVRQRAQRLGQQAYLLHVHEQVALVGALHGALGADDVAQVPGLDLGQGLFRQGLAIHIHLDARAGVLDDHEGATVEHDAPRHLDRDALRFQLFPGLVRVVLQDVASQAVAAEVVGEDIALGALGGKFFLALGDQAVFFLMQGVRVQRLFAHGVCVSRQGAAGAASSLGARGAPGCFVCTKAGIRIGACHAHAPGCAYRPCFRLASMNSSRSPSSTASQLLSSMPVRRSLMRDWSST